MKTWYLLQEILGTKQDPDYPDDKSKRIPNIVRTYVSEVEDIEALETRFVRRVAGVEPVSAETFQDAMSEFGIKPRHQRIA